MRVPSRARNQYRVAVIRVSGTWRPQHWDDFPQTGMIVTVSESPCTRAFAEGCVHQFNTASLEQGRAEWAVILDPHAACAPGDRCERQPALFGRR